MSVENFEVFKGDALAFQVEGTKFTVHKSLISRKSKLLEAKMEGGKYDVPKRFLVINNTDVNTFGRFVEYLYSGDYNPASPVQPHLNKSRSHGSSEELNHANDDTGQSTDTWGFTDIKSNDSIAVAEATSWPEPIQEEIVTPSMLKKGRKKRIPIKSISIPEPIETSEELFAPTSPDTLRSPTTEVNVTPTITTSSKINAYADWNLDYLPLLLSHAKLHVFASVYEIIDLQRLTARRLDEALDVFQFAKSCATDITPLLEYVYQPIPDLDIDIGILKTVVLNFVARNIKDVIDLDGFQSLIEKGGQLGLDVLRKTVCRL